MDSSQPVTSPQRPETVEVETTDRFEAPDIALADALLDLPERIERLAELDPAEAAEPGAAIADLLSGALEEEER